MAQVMELKTSEGLARAQYLVMLDRRSDDFLQEYPW